jgi:putative Mg2+ transporter-C (MgtC) family protein
MELNPPMQFEWPDAEIALRLGIATLAGLILGFDREVRGHAAGLRTHGMIALTSAMMTVSAILLYHQLGGEESSIDPLRMYEATTAAIGIIAAGIIIVRGGDVRNLTSATHVWLTAMVGIASGAGQYPLVLLGGLTALVLLVVVRVAERYLPRKNEPVDRG